MAIAKNTAVKRSKEETPGFQFLKEIEKIDRV